MHFISTPRYRAYLFCAVVAALLTSGWAATNAQTYCTPLSSTGCNSFDYINSVSFGTFSNNLTNCNGQPNGYIFYSALNINAAVNKFYTMTFTPGTGAPMGIAAWIDYNKNGVFETTERIFASASASTSPSSSFTTIPANATLGVTRMRVRAVYNRAGTLIDPCAESVNAETEDYPVTILPPVGNQVSDIITTPGFVYSANTNYAATANQGFNVTSTSVAVMGITIRDGGGSPDADAFPTTLNAIVVGITNPAQLRRIALYDGTTEIVEASVSSSTTSITFGGFALSAPDNGTKDLLLRVTYNSTVTDNLQNQFSITAANADGETGSVFATANAGGATSSIAGDDNRIEVTGTTIGFRQFVGGSAFFENVLSPASQTAEFGVRDALSNFDADYSGQITISNAKLSGGDRTASLINGTATFSQFLFTAKSASETFTATSAGLAAGTSFSFTIAGSNLSDVIENPAFTYPQNIPYALPANQGNTVTVNSQAVASFIVRDGGATGDADSYPTGISQIVLLYTYTTEANPVRRLALFDGTTKLSDVTLNGSGSINVNFTGLSIVVPDNGTKELTIRAVYQTNVNDNAQSTYKITGVVANLTIGGSVFPSYPSATLPVQPATPNTGDINRIEVVGQFLSIYTQPQSHLLGQTTSIGVYFSDNMGSGDRDLDATPITITNSKLVNSPIVGNVSNGNFELNSLTFNAIGTNEMLTVSAPGFSTVQSTPFTISVSNESVVVPTAGFPYTSNIDYLASANQGGNVTAASVGVMGLSLMDGGTDQTDADGAPTIITGLTINVTNGGNINRAALYDGTTELAEVAVTGPSITFTGLNVAATDNGVKNLVLRVTFKSVVTDNIQSQFMVASVTAHPSMSSLFALPDGGITSIFCLPVFAFNSSNGDFNFGMWLTNVTFADMSNTTGFNDIAVFPNKVAHVTAGQTYSFSATREATSPYGCGLAVWIDYNQNAILEPSEQVFASTDIRSGSQAPFSTTIQVPAGAFNGATTMRVRTDYNMPGTSSAPCGEVNFYGEVEDYPVVISGGVDGPPPAIVVGAARTPLAGDINRLEVTASTFAFTQQPTNVNMEQIMTPPVAVRAIDANGNNDVDYNGGISITHYGLMNSPVTVTAVNGAASFSTLSFNQPGNNTTLTASFGSMTPAQSAPFTIFVKKIVWLQGTSIVGTSDGQLLQTWNDDAGFNDKAEQITSAFRPTYRSTGVWAINSQPSLQFATGKGLGMAARDEVNGGSEKVIFAVFKTGSNVLTNQVLVDIGGIGSGFNMYIKNNNLYAGAWDNYNAWLSRSVSGNTVYLAQFVCTGTNMNVSAHAAPNGAGSATTTAFADNITASPYGNSIGAAMQQTRYHNATNINAGLSDAFQGSIAEVIILNNAHLDGRTQIWEYLNQKYAIGMTAQPIAKYAAEEQTAIESDDEAGLSVYPNPSSDETVLSYSVPVEGRVRLLLQNVLGETVIVVQDGILKAGAHQAAFNCGDLPAGMYRAMLITPTGSMTTPVVIQR